MMISLWKDKNTGEWITDDGQIFDIDDYILIDIFDFCGCGHTKSAVEHIIGALKLIKEKDEINKNTKFEDWYEEWAEKVSNFFNHDRGAQTIMWYCFDRAGLTDHGGSVPGWLTEKGYDLIDLYEKVT